MEKKVKISEILMLNVIIILLLMIQYWQLSRTSYNAVMQNKVSNIGLILSMIVIYFYFHKWRKYKKEEKDEFTIQVLGKCDAIKNKLLVIMLFLTAFIGGTFGHINVITTESMGWMIMISLLITSIIKCILYFYYDKKGF